MICNVGAGLRCLSYIKVMEQLVTMYTRAKQRVEQSYFVNKEGTRPLMARAENRINAKSVDYRLVMDFARNLGKTLNHRPRKEIDPILALLTGPERFVGLD